MAQFGPGVDEPHHHTRHRGGDQPAAAWVGTYLGQPGCGHVDPADGHIAGHLRHQRRLVGSQRPTRDRCDRRGTGGGRRGRGQRRGGARCRWCERAGRGSRRDRPGSRCSGGRCSGSLLLVGHQRGDLVAGERTAQVAHRPARREHLGLVLAGAAQHELALGQTADGLAHGVHVDTARRDAHPVEQAHLVALGLQSADHPGTCVRQGLVVDVDRVLGAHHHAHTEGASLLEQRHHRLFGGWVRRGRQITRHLVHVQQGAQVGGAALAAHPGDQFAEHQGGDELALGVAEVGSGDDGAARRTRGCAQHGVDVEWTAAHPRPERRRGQQAVQPHGERVAVVRREELVELEHAQLADGRLQRQAHQRGDVEPAAVLPLVDDQVGEQDVFAARQRVGIDAHQAQQAAHEPAHLVGDGLEVAHVARDGERTHHVERHARRGARRVHGEVDPLTQRPDVGAAQAPAGQPLGPGLGLPGGIVGHGLAGLLGVAGVHPRFEVAGRQFGEREAQIGEVALRVDEQRRNAGAQRLLDQHHAQAGLARPGHAHDHPVRGEVAGPDDGVLVGALMGGGVDHAAEQEVGHERRA